MVSHSHLKHPGISGLHWMDLIRFITWSPEWGSLRSCCWKVGAEAPSISKQLRSYFSVFVLVSCRNDCHCKRISSTVQQKIFSTVDKKPLALSNRKSLALPERKSLALLSSFGDEREAKFFLLVSWFYGWWLSGKTKETLLARFRWAADVDLR